MQKKKENSGERYRKIIKRRRIFVLSILLLIILLCVCLFTPVFGISDISVTGNTLLASEDIIAASGIEKGENVFRISGKKAARKLSKLAYVEGAKIKRKFPAKIVIEVDEAKQDIIIDTPREFIVVTMNGRVLEKSEDVTKLTSPIVYGIDIKEAEPAKVIKPETEDKFKKNIERLMCFYETDFWKDIDEFYVSDTSNFIMTMKSGMKVTFGDVSNIEILGRKIKMIEQILPQIKQTENSYLDLTTDKGYFGEYTAEELEEMKQREESGESIADALIREKEEEARKKSAETDEKEEKEEKKETEQ